MAYIGLGLFFALYIGHKLICRTKMVPLLEVDLDTGKSAAIGRTEEMTETPTSVANINWCEGANIQEKSKLAWKQFRTTRMGRVLDNI